MNQTLSDRIVLIVDDDERNTFALLSYLEILEMKVLTAKDGKEAIHLLQEGTPVDIILLDMMMPEMDGFETLNFLKGNDALKKIPVIAVTARAMKGDREKCISAGAWDYIPKPIDLKICVEKMVHLL